MTTGRLLLFLAGGILAFVLVPFLAAVIVGTVSIAGEELASMRLDIHRMQGTIEDMRGEVAKLNGEIGQLRADMTKWRDWRSSSSLASRAKPSRLSPRLGRMQQEAPGRPPPCQCAS